jgi:ComF family protein
MRLLDVMLPAACGGCGRYGRLLCEACRAALRPASNELDLFLATDAGLVLGESLELAHAAFIYAGPLRHALSRLKYGGAARLARPLAELAAPALHSLLSIAGAAALVPVPVHALRLRQRGYNQAGLLAAELARLVGLPLTEALVRERPTTQQHRLDRAARLRNLRDAFAAQPATRPPRTVILVDDILTTSATLEACATVLRAAGAERVLGFAIAREV